MLPIRARFRATLAAPEQRRFAERARRLVAGDPAISATIDFAGDVRPGSVPGAGLVYEDHSAIGLALPGEEARYEYRMRALAGSGDMLLLGAAAHAGFDAYCRDMVGLGATQVVQAPSATRAARYPALAQRCRNDARFFARRADFARAAGGMTLHPYACCGHDWLLGYFGRCSLDAVLVGDEIERSDLHWIECNGRWGGVSIPLVLANRLAPEATANLVIVQQVDGEQPPREFAAVLQRLGSLLYRHGQRHRGVVIMSPRLLESGGGMQFVSIGDSPEDARRLAAAARRLLAE